MEAKTRRMSLSTPERVRTREEVLPIYNKSVMPVRSTSKMAYQEHNRNVKEEGNHGVRCECEHAYAINVLHVHARKLSKEADEAVHESACRGIVVQGNEG